MLITLPNNLITGIMSNGNGIAQDLMPLVLLFAGVPLAIFILEGLLGYLSGSSDRLINRAVEGKLPANKTLTAGQWAEVYRRKGAGYKEWVKGEKITEKDYLINRKNY